MEKRNKKRKKNRARRVAEMDRRGKAVMMRRESKRHWSRMRVLNKLRIVLFWCGKVVKVIVVTRLSWLYWLRKKIRSSVGLDWAFKVVISRAVSHVEAGDERFKWRALLRIILVVIGGKAGKKKRRTFFIFTRVITVLVVLSRVGWARVVGSGIGRVLVWWAASGRRELIWMRVYAVLGGRTRVIIVVLEGRCSVGNRLLGWKKSGELKMKRVKAVMRPKRKWRYKGRVKRFKKIKKGMKGNVIMIVRLIRITMLRVVIMARRLRRLKKIG